MNNHLLLENIETYVEKLNLKSRAFSNLEKMKQAFFETEELIDGYSINELIFKFENHKITLETEHKAASITVRIGIFINDKDKVWLNNLKPIGYYDYEVAFDGNFFDDYFVIKESK